jgi:DNA (cytosine-5)-methyltransferase 1
MGRVVDGLAYRIDRVKAIGNGQVPAVAATAFRILSEGLPKEAD